MLKKVWVIISLIGLILVPVFFLMKFPKKDIPFSPHDKLIKAGQYLFFDTRLSSNNTKSCSSCHDPKFAFTDNYRSSITALGENVKHNAPTLINVALYNYFDWANPSITTLEKQHIRPLFNDNPAELGAKGNEILILTRLKNDKHYQYLFSQLFPTEKEPINFSNIIKALSSFIGSLLSFNAPYDKFIKGDTGALNISAKAGMTLFFSKKLNCSGCHIPPVFTAAAFTKNTDSIYFNTGLYNIGNNNKYPFGDNGIIALTANPKDEGKFKTPTLRNIALTAPYMHDGSINTLEEVIDIYQQGGQFLKTGPHAGDGRLNLFKNKMIGGFVLSKQEKNELLSFLFCLTDSSILSNPKFQQPTHLKNN